ncbi:MAG TPA: hypothetical protein VHA56_17490 [Mucilaginibacter sp.]|nr:hypothetical protein [Mucilaginibacter sp.]
MYIYTPLKKGHYNDYAAFIAKLLFPRKVEIIKEKKSKLRHIFSRRPVLFLDIDDKDIFWILLRILSFRKSFALSVSLERVLDKSKPLRAIKNNVLYTIYLILKRLGLLRLISILKDTDFENKLNNIVSIFIHDIQFYDLDHLNICAVPPVEISQRQEADGRKVVLIVNNTSSDKKNLNSLSEFIGQTKKYFFIVVGKRDFLDGERADNYITIERYVTNEELLYLMKYVDIIYCYYNNNKPSGFMGRALQLNKYVIVEDGSHLSRVKYDKVIRLKSLSELENYTIDNSTSGLADSDYYNDAENLKNFLNKNTEFGISETRKHLFKQ